MRWYIAAQHWEQQLARLKLGCGMLGVLQGHRIFWTLGEDGVVKYCRWIEAVNEAMSIWS